ncbi:MAG: ABC transporter permease [Bdellovibrionia bacterium]
MLEVKNLSFSYKIGNREVEVLKNLNFNVSSGEFVGIQGPSGSGKSTLFYILGFLLKASSGQLRFNGLDITKMSGDELTVLRNQKIGFVFQQFHLLSRTSVLDNILLPTLYPSELAVKDSKSHYKKSKDKAKGLLKTLGIPKHSTHFPNQLSGGQQQRVAIARALIHDVDWILADEPTGNLDSESARQTLELLKELNQQGKTVILITHDREVSKYCSKVYLMKDGAFVEGQSNAVNSKSKSSVVNSLRSDDAMKSLRHSPRLPAISIATLGRIIKSVFPLALDNLLRNKAKSFLTQLGVIIGVAAVLITITLGQYAKRKILESYEILGVNKLMLRGHPNWYRKATDAAGVSFHGFDPERDLGAIQRIFPEITLLSPILLGWKNTVTSGGKSLENDVSVYGITPEYFAITHRSLLSGHMISPSHLENRSAVCLIGTEVVQRLFERTSPLGQIVTVTDRGSTSYPCQVIGILKPVVSNKEGLFPNKQLYLPYTYFQVAAAQGMNARVHDAALQLDSSADVELTGKKIKAYFNQKYEKTGVFYVDQDSTLVAQMKRFLNIFTMLIGAVACLCLVVGGIGVNNMMLVSVTERIKEFGIRKALGATQLSIRIQVLVESLILCFAAGVMGVFLGWGGYETLIYAASRFIPSLHFEWIFDPVAMFLSFISILVVGIASGLVPAQKAEKLQIIEALRSE